MLAKSLILILLSTNLAVAGPQWGDESVTDDFVISGHHIARVTDSDTVELRWKNSGSLIWRYDPNPNNLPPCSDVVHDVERIAIFYNRVVVMGNDRCGYGRADLVARGRGTLITHLPLTSYQQAFCGFRANIFVFAVCTLTSAGTFYSDGIKVFKTRTGASLFASPAVQPGELYEHLWKAVDFDIIRGHLVIAFEHGGHPSGLGVPPFDDFTRTQVVSYRIADGRQRWRRKFNAASPRTSVKAGAYLTGTPGSENFYSTITGNKLNW